MGDTSTMFSELAAVSSVLGGFSLAFLGATLSSPDRCRARGAVVLISVPATLMCVLAALSWSLLTVAAGALELSFMVQVHRTASLLFFGGIGTFFMVVGASGWIYSKWMGWLSSLAALLALITGASLLKHFVH